jgi:hypothetical protein
MDCLFCKYPIPSGAIVCAHCGAEMNSEVEEEATPIYQRILNTIFIIPIIYIGVYLLNKWKGENVPEMPVTITVAIIYFFLVGGRWLAKHKVWWTRNGVSRMESD